MYKRQTQTAGEIMIQLDGRRDNMVRQRQRFLDLLLRHAIFECDLLESGVREDTHIMQLGKMQPFHLHDEVHCRLRLFLRFRRKAVHRIQSNNNLRICTDDVVEILTQSLDTKILAHELLETRRRAFERQIHALRSALHHEVNGFLIEQIAAQPTLEIKAHIHLGINDLAEERLELLDVDVECIVDELALSHAHIMQILHLIEHALHGAAPVHGCQMLHITVEAAIGTAACCLHCHLITNATLPYKLMIFVIVHQTAIPSR